MNFANADVTKIETLQRQAIIDLAGAVIEDDQRSDAARADLKNAIDRCHQIIELVGRGDPAKLFGGLAKRAAQLVIENRDKIDKLAQQLGEVGEMTGEEIDACLARRVT